jgi:hypothetical protein
MYIGSFMYVYKHQNVKCIDWALSKVTGMEGCNVLRLQKLAGKKISANFFPLNLIIPPQIFY